MNKVMKPMFLIILIFLASKIQGLSRIIPKVVMHHSAHLKNPPYRFKKACASAIGTSICAISSAAVCNIIDKTLLHDGKGLLFGTLFGSCSGTILATIIAKKPGFIGSAGASIAALIITKQKN
jgi:hypothetical protein